MQNNAIFIAYGAFLLFLLYFPGRLFVISSFRLTLFVFLLGVFSSFRLAFFRLLLCSLFVISSLRLFFFFSRFLFVISSFRLAFFVSLVFSFRYLVFSSGVFRLFSDSLFVISSNNKKTPGNKTTKRRNSSRRNSAKR